jgi:hypothetical protein
MSDRSVAEPSLLGAAAQTKGVRPRASSYGAAAPPSERKARAGEAGYGAEGDRTPDLLAASQTLSQLSYGPGMPEV